MYAVETDEAALRDLPRLSERFQLFVRPVLRRDPALPWLGRDALAQPERPPLAGLMARINSRSSAADRKVASASLTLRVGWAGGFAIASYLALGRVPHPGDHALLFSDRTSLQAVWIGDVRFSDRRSLEAAALRARLLESLLAIAEPILEAQFAWSRFSRRAMWAMVTSSWASQFASVARQLGDPALGKTEAEALFALRPDLARAAPELYEIRAGGGAQICQKRGGCCLIFRYPGADYCASCPLIPEAERLDRQRRWVATLM